MRFHCNCFSHIGKFKHENGKSVLIFPSWYFKHTLMVPIQFYSDICIYDVTLINVPT